MKRLENGMFDLWKKLFLITAIVAGGLQLGGVSEADAVTLINNPNSPTTTVTFDTPGTYAFQVTAFDGFSFRTAITTVTVNSVFPKVSGGSTGGIGGNGVDLWAFFSTGTVPVASLQFDMMLPAGVSTPTVTAGPAALAAGKSVQGNPIAGGLRVLVFGVNQTPIGSGQIISVNLRLDPTLPTSTQVIPITGVVGSDAAGVSVVMQAAPSATIIVTANRPPNLTVSANQTITLPATATLVATATDDGAPNPPGALTYTWIKL